MIYTNCDGGSRGNPGKGAIGVLIRDGDKTLAKYSAYIGDKVTNNLAEYAALIKTLEIASKFTKGMITCCLDSELVVKQLLGEYQVKNERLKELFLKVQELQENFEKIMYVHVGRDNKYQKIVDKMLNRELDKLNE